MNNYLTFGVYKLGEILSRNAVHKRYCCESRALTLNKFQVKH